MRYVMRKTVHFLSWPFMFLPLLRSYMYMSYSSNLGTVENMYAYIGWVGRFDDSFLPRRFPVPNSVYAMFQQKRFFHGTIRNSHDDFCRCMLHKPQGP